MKLSELPKITAVINIDEVRLVVMTRAEYKKLFAHIRVEGQIDEDHYRRAHPDVDASIKARKTKSALDHYLQNGYFEKRAVKLR